MTRILELGTGAQKLFKNVTSKPGNWQMQIKLSNIAEDDDVTESCSGIRYSDDALSGQSKYEYNGNIPSYPVPYCEIAYSFFGTKFFWFSTETILQ